jgi:palmitoyltransferase
MAPPAVIGSQKPGAINAATEQKIGQATSVIIPLLELGALGYETYVLVYLICVKYLIDPSANIRDRYNVQPRRSTGIALIAVYAILLLLLLAAWMRLIQMIWSKPDLVPLGDSSREKTDASTNGFAFDQYDAYTCDYQGTPCWCEKCHNWKPDRTHHCKELGRCVRKMDHYCPWAGGIIGESTHKFFMQFVAYAALYTTYVWIVVAVFLAERHSKVSLIQSAKRGAECLLASDGFTTRHMDRSARHRGPVQHLHLHHVLHDRLEPDDQLHLSRRYPTRRHL